MGDVESAAWEGGQARDGEAAKTTTVATARLCSTARPPPFYPFPLSPLPPLRNLTSSSRPPSLHSLFLWNFVALSGWSSSTRHPPSSSLFDALIPVSLRVYLPRPRLWALISLYTLGPWLQRTPRTVHASLPRTSTTRTSTPTHPTRIPRTVATTQAPPRSTATPLRNTNTSPTSHRRRSTAMVTGEPVQGSPWT